MAAIKTAATASKRAPKKFALPAKKASVLDREVKAAHKATGQAAR